MNKIKIIIAALLLLLTVLPFIPAKEKVIIYGDSNYPPYSYDDNGEAKGIYVTILKQAFAQMSDYDVEIKTMPWKRGLDMVKDGSSAGLFPPYFSQERTSWMEFSEPILKEKVIVFGTKEKLKGKTKWPDDFYNSKIGLNSGFGPTVMGGEAFVAAVKAGKMSIDEAANNDMNLKKLEAGRIDFYLNDQLVDISAYRTITRGIETVSNFGHIGFTKQTNKYPFLKDFISKFNAIIVKMKKEGKIDAIVNQFINKK